MPGDYFFTDPLLKRLGITVGRRVSHAVSVGLVAFFYPVSHPLFAMMAVELEGELEP